MCAKYSLPPFDWLKLSHHLVSGESTLHEVTLFEARSRIFLPTAQSCAALFCCRLATRASSLGWLVGNLILCKVIKLCKSPRSLCPSKHRQKGSNCLFNANSVEFPPCLHAIRRDGQIFQWARLKFQSVKCRRR